VRRAGGAWGQQTEAWRMRHALRQPRNDADCLRLRRWRKHADAGSAVVQRPADAERGIGAGSESSGVCQSLRARGTPGAERNRRSVGAPYERRKSCRSVRLSPCTTPSATPSENTHGFVGANLRKAATTAFGGQWPACSIASTRSYANPYSNEIGLRWPQRVLADHSMRVGPKGTKGGQAIMVRIAPATPTRVVFKSAIRRQFRRARVGP